MAILIGAIYVWASYGVVFALGGLHLGPGLNWTRGPGLLWTSLGVAFSLGLARLAHRHSPKQLAWGVLGPNPGWGWLVFATMSTFAKPDTSGEGYAYFEAFALVGIIFGVEAALLSLGLHTKFGGEPQLEGWWRRHPVLRSMIINMQTSESWPLGGKGGKGWQLSRMTQIILGATISGFWAFVFSSVALGLNLWRPSPFESYILLALSLNGIMWALTHGETLERTAKAQP